MSDGFVFDAFISYRRSDGRRSARWLREALERYRLPRALRSPATSKLRIYLDTAFYERNIRPALLQSRYLIVVVTPAALQPRPDGKPNWVEREIEDFRRSPQGRNIIVARGRGDLLAPLPGTLAQDFPNMEIIDLTGLSPMRFIAWSRWRRLHDELLKLIAPLRDIAPEEMPELRREAMRRQRKRYGFAATVVASIAMVALFALLQMGSARDREKLARSSQLIQASTAARDSQPLLAAMLAREAIRLDDNPGARNVLFAALARARARKSMVVHHPGVNAARWSPDGTSVLTLRAGRLAVTDDDRIVRVWDLAGTLISELESPHEGAVHDAIWSPDGTRILTAHGGWTAAVHDDGGRTVALLRAGGEIETAAWNADATKVLIAREGGPTVIWDATGARVGTVAEGNSVTNAAWSPDGERLLTLGHDPARLWNSAGERIAILPGGFRAGGWSPDGQRVLTVSGMYDSAVVWDRNGHRLAVLDRDYAQATWGPDSRHILTVARGSTAQVWELETCAPSILRGDLESVKHAAWSPDGQHVLTSSFDRTVRIWDLSGNMLAQIEEPSATAAWAVRPVGYSSIGNPMLTAQLWPRWSADGERILILTNDSMTDVWNVRGRKLLSLAGAPAEAAASPSGQLVLVRDRNRLEVRDLSGRTLATLDVVAAGVTQAGWRPDETALLTVSDHGRLEVWDFSGERLFARGDETHRIVGALWSPGGRYVFAFSGDSLAEIFDRDGVRVGALHAPANTIESAVWSPDDERIFTYSRRLPVGALWNVRGERLDSLSGLFQFAAWSRDSRLLLTLAMGDDADIIDRNGHDVVTLAGHTARIRHAAWSPLGDRIVTASYDGTARVWDTSGKQLLSFDGHDDIVSSAAWSPDGACVLTTSVDGTARVWPAVPLLDYADQRLDRDFTHYLILQRRFRLSSACRSGQEGVWGIARAAVGRSVTPDRGRASGLEGSMRQKRV